jgi:hypothetical protein
MSVRFKERGLTHYGLRKLSSLASAMLYNGMNG